MAGPIVVGIDTSSDSVEALVAAADLAEERHIPMIAIYVRHEPSLAAMGSVAGEALTIETTLDELGETARTQVANAMAERHVDWQFEVSAGDPGSEIIKAAVEHHASTIIVGGRNHGVVGGLMLGSVAQKLVRKSPVSVLVVRYGHAQKVNEGPSPATDAAAPSLQ